MAGKVRLNRFQVLGGESGGIHPTVDFGVQLTNSEEFMVVQQSEQVLHLSQVLDQELVKVSQQVMVLLQ